MLTITPAQIAAFQSTRRDRLARLITLDLAQIVHENALPLINYGLVRIWVDESIGYGVDVPSDVIELAHYFAEMHRAGGRPESIQRVLEDSDAGGSLKVRQVRLTLRHMAFS